MKKEIPLLKGLDCNSVVGRLEIDEATMKEIAEITYETQTPITLLPTIAVKNGEPELIALGFSYTPYP